MSKKVASSSSPNPFRLAYQMTTDEVVGAKSSAEARTMLLDYETALARIDTFARRELNLEAIERHQTMCRKTLSAMYERLGENADPRDLDGLLTQVFEATADVYARSGYLLGMSSGTILPTIDSLESKRPATKGSLRTKGRRQGQSRVR